MSLFVRRRARRALAPWALALPLLVACEDTPEFTEPEEVTFTAVAIDKASVRPREGERLTVGPTEYDVNVDVHWQEMPSGSTLGVWLETHDSVTGQTFRWEGDLVAEFVELTTTSGSTTIETTVVLPEVSPFCGSYDYLRILAVVFPGGESPPNSAYRDEVFYQVSGSDWTGPCVSNVFAIFPGVDYRVGEPVLVYGRDLPDALDVSLPGALQDDNVWPAFIAVPEGLSLLPVPNDGYMIAFIPVGAETGQLRAFAGATETRYAPNGEQILPINPSNDDVFEPNNSPETARDSIFLNLWDPFGFWGSYGFNPSLTLSGADLNADPLAPAYGEGDWFFLYLPFNAPAAFEQDLCVSVVSHDDADLDVYVYDALGAIADSSASPTGTEAVRVNDVSGSDFYWVWVTPFRSAFSSATGGYTYEVGPCAAATGFGVARPNGPLGFRPEIGGAPPAGVARPGPGSLGIPDRAAVRRGGGR